MYLGKYMRFCTYCICAKAFMNSHVDIASGARSKFWPESSFTSKLYVCKHQRLWGVCTYVQTQLSIHCLTMGIVQNFRCRLIYQLT